MKTRHKRKSLSELYFKSGSNIGLSPNNILGSENYQHTILLEYHHCSQSIHSSLGFCGMKKNEISCDTHTHPIVLGVVLLPSNKVVNGHEHLLASSAGWTTRTIEITAVIPSKQSKVGHLSWLIILTQATYIPLPKNSRPKMIRALTIGFTSKSLNKNSNKPVEHTQWCTKVQI